MTCTCGAKPETGTPSPMCKRCAIEYYGAMLTYNAARRMMRPQHALIEADRRAEERRISLELLQVLTERQAIWLQARTVNDMRAMRKGPGRRAVHPYASPGKP